MKKLLYSKNTLVATIDALNHITWFNKELAPLYLKRTEYFLGWLQSRCIDTQRQNAKMLTRALRLSEKDEEELVLEVNAACITDTYWVKDENSNLTWEQVQFKKARFSGLALVGTSDQFSKAEKAKNKKTQELTNIGSFEKCWRVKEGQWWLYKEADTLKLFSELFVYKLGKEFGFNMAEYRCGSTYIKPGTRYIMSKDFTCGHKYNLEPIIAVTGSSVENYIRTYQKINEISPAAASDYVSMIFMDALIFNPDRHEYNFGFLSNPDTGEIVGLAPNFDNNLALVSSGYPATSQRSADVLITDFNELLDYGVNWGKYSAEKTLPPLKETVIKRIIREIGLKVRGDFIAKYIMSSYAKIGWGKTKSSENNY